MDPNISAQDVLRCYVCRTPVPPYCCELCHTYLCQKHAGEHLSNESEDHKVIPIQQQWIPNYPKCHRHSMNPCELFCKQCEWNICTECISSGKHEQHEKITIYKRCQSIKEALQRALKLLDTFIFPKYQEAASRINIQKADLITNMQILSKSVRDEGEVWHKEIDAVIQILQSKIKEMETEHLSTLEKQESNINQRISEISQTILDLKELMDSHDFCLISECKFSIDEFRTLPQQLNVTLPKFSSQNINKEQLLEQFGSLSEICVSMEDFVYPPESEVSNSSTPDRPLLDEPKITACISTQYRSLYNVACRNDNEVWTRGLDRIMRLYNLQGDLLQSIKTKSLNEPYDLTVLQRGELVYTDFKDGSVNMLRKSEIQRLVKRVGLINTWKPLGVCTTSSADEILVSMARVDDKKTKVVRYSGYREIQRIQKDDNGEELFSPGFSSKCLSENRNLNICVADHGAKAVVVVTSFGKVRFRYTGNLQTTNESFAPAGITTDSHCRILTADCFRQCIHILNQDGQFLCYIKHGGLGRPWGLCIDSNDNLIVGDWDTGKVKRVQYYQ